MITRIGQKTDGTLIGEDEDGNIVSGRVERVGWDRVERTYSRDGDTWTVEYKVGDTLIGKGTFQHVEDADMDAYIEAAKQGQAVTPPPGFNPKYMPYEAAKKTISIPLPDGTNVEYERLIEVEVWEN